MVRGWAKMDQIFLSYPIIISWTNNHIREFFINKLVHFILIDWLDQDDMLTAKKALTNRRKEQCSIHQLNEQLPKKALKPLDVKMVV
jgi:hypothetical protein